ncbi:MAG: phosphoribosylformylglycinamidine synthase subunit PurQ [Pyrodictiaceae archaeon]
MARIAVIKYPGTNCEEETAYAVRNVSRVDAEIVWHTELRWREWDAIIIPGGFSYGDYGRAGLIASWSSSINELREAIDNDVPVLGICNGFQILVEAGLLPGALLPNETGTFVARWLWLRIHNPRGPWLLKVVDDAMVSMPIAHAEGRYYVDDPGTVKKSPWLEYLSNPNGSVAAIAGVSSRDGLVLGIMPHPERAAFPWQAPPGFSAGGRLIFESIGQALREGW